MPIPRVGLMFPTVLILLSFVANSGQTREAIRPPNIVLIVADDLGYGDLSCQGSRSIRTPNIDAFAREGTRFTNFCVAQPVCTASRAALMSGCYPNRIGMAGALNHTSLTGIHPDEMLLPELLKARGYATAHFGKWHLGTRPEFYPTRHGFDTWAGIPYSNDNGPLHPTIRGIPSLPFIVNDTVVEKDPDQSLFTRRLTDMATDFIRKNKSRPFFLYLPHIMPHVPIYASEKFSKSTGHGLYADVVEELDAGIGEVLGSIRDAGINGDTLVMFLSDNGPFLSYGNHAGSAGPFREGKLTTFEGGVRVPFIVRWPGHVPSGRVDHRFFTGLDLLPSLGAIAGTPTPKSRIDGLDLSRVLLGNPDAVAREEFAYYSGGELHAVRKGRWKLHLPHPYLAVDGLPGRDGKPANHANMKPVAIEESGIRGIASRHGYKVEQLPLSLYDLESDPGESRNVAGDQPAIVAELERLASRCRADLGDTLAGARGSGNRPAGKAKS